ncbi:MAG TPA: LAGLIDADG family homing endonuclease [Tepidisphaeraceae bacterium]|nr:LAGLIDADG family homing endonuclease [Tepidisphaeraceae bacterium]
MKITRRFTQPGQDVFCTVQYDKRTSRISNPDGSVVFEMNDAEIPSQWSQLATDIMVSKYFRKAGVPQTDAHGNIVRDAQGNAVTGPEKSAKQVINRLAGCWRYWGEKHGYFDSAEDAQAFYDELAYMLLHQMCAPNSPQWFNTGLNFAYGITGPAQGHFYCDPKTGELLKSRDAYSHPQPHACQPYHAPVSTPRGRMPIGRIVEQNLVGLEVYDGTRDGTGTTRVVAVKHNGKKIVHRAVLEGGIAIEATGDHLVYVLNTSGLGGRWVRMDSLDKGMQLVRVSFAEQRDRQIAGKVRATAASVAGSSDGFMDESLLEASPTPLIPVEPLPVVEYLSVVRVKAVGNQNVYDIQTESGQYLTNDVIVHNCFIQSVGDDLVNPGGIMDLWTREARLFKYGSGTGSNFSKVRGENEPLSGGGKSSGLMSFLKIGDRAAGAIKSGGTTRRAAKMVCLDLDHPDVESFINWKVREELKVAAMVEGMKILPKEQQAQAKKLGLKLDYDFNGESYMTVSGQNSNNSVRIPNRFFKAVEEDGDWHLTWRSNGKVSKTIKARELWDQIAFAAWRCADPGVQYDDTINQWHTCPKSGRINASNPCVTGDTRVLTPGGIWRRIDQMIHLPARIITNLHAQQVSTTEGAFPTGNREVFELRTIGGYSVKLTADHKVWTRTRGWVEARDLQTTDEVRLPSKPACVSEIGEPQDPRFFELLGLLLSGANGNVEALKLDKCLADADTIEQFAQYVNENWGDGLYNDDYANPEMVGNAADENSGNTLTATLTNRRLLSRLKAYVRSESGALRLSDEAYTAGLAAQKHLLSALFTADANFIDGTLELAATSSGFLEDIQLILLGFGVQSAIVAEGTNGPRNDSTMGNGSSFVPSSLRRSIPSPLSTQHSALSTFPSLRIDSASLRFFADRIGLLPGRKSNQLGAAASFSIVRDEKAGHFERFASLTSLGTQQVFDLTEPRTSSFIANGLTVHNCSEYMFLDDTACNLASLNVLTFFDSEARRFDVEGYKHGCRLWTMVLEISVLMASFPSESIARLSYQYRTLGLGYANLGAMLMQAGIPYDSAKGRAICAALSAILTGESYACSAEMARELGAFPMYDANRGDMLRVMRNHRRAAYDVRENAPALRGMGDYENLDILPVGIDAAQFADSDPMAPRSLLASARECWDRALTLGEKHGYRNAQTTVIAPTGTIGLLMDCDTTGVEPDFALVKFKKLAGGGYFKIANQSLRPALVNLGYEPGEIHQILQYVMGTLTLHGAPYLEYDQLKNLGLTDAELDKIEASLPGVFEISFAFSPWTLGAEVMKRFEIPESEWQHPNFNFLRKVGFNKRQIDEANDIICGRGTVEGAPSMKQEHLPVFDCANKCGKTGVRYIQVEGHIRMMAAAQPFITGAISKTINLPNDASLDDIKNSYELSWKLGLKANALYRDGSKLSQPLNVKSDEDLDKKTDAEDEADVAAAKEEVARDVAKAAMVISSSAPITSDNISPVPHTIEKIVERIVERPLRRRLPDTRSAKTHKFDVAGHEGYITVGLYDDGQPGEVFIRIAKEGSTIGGLMDTIATLVSVSLQYGVPVESLVRKFEHVRFEPSGMTRNPEIPMAKSLVDYIFRWLAMEFVPGFRAAFAPKREKKPAPPSLAAPSPAPAPSSETRGQSPAGSSAFDADASAGMSTSLPPTDGLSAPPAAPTPKKGNGHGPRLAPDTAKSFNYDTPIDTPPEGHYPSTPSTTTTTSRLAMMADPLSQQGSEMQADAPACDVCGSITVRSGTCYKCMNCGNSMGCS